MKIKRYKIDKLIRDHIPEILSKEGITVNSRIMEKDEYVQRLKDKLLEEAEEVKNTDNQDDLTEELADMLEVIQSIAQVNGLSMELIEKKRLHKRNIKGGFDRRIYNYSVEVDESSEAFAYYKQKIPQYPDLDSPSHQPECLFCQIARGEKEVKYLATFKHCYVIKDQFPVSDGHILIIPKEHTENWFTAREDVRLDMMNALLLMKDRLEIECSPDGYNIGANCGETAGQSIMHLHLHLIPRYQGDMQDPKGGVRGVIPSKQKY